MTMQHGYPIRWNDFHRTMTGLWQARIHESDWILVQLLAKSEDCKLVRVQRTDTDEVFDTTWDRLNEVA